MTLDDDLARWALSEHGDKPYEALIQSMTGDPPVIAVEPAVNPAAEMRDAGGRMVAFVMPLLPLVALLGALLFFVCGCRQAEGVTSPGAPRVGEVGQTSIHRFEDEARGATCWVLGYYRAISCVSNRELRGAHLMERGR
jgi:hypothetical protein